MDTAPSRHPENPLVKAGVPFKLHTLVWSGTPAVDFHDIIGDKLSDLEPAKQVGAKSIFLRGGHSVGGEEDFADYTIDNAKELENIVQ